jgi:probable rRNA maturation factor
MEPSSSRPAQAGISVSVAEAGWRRSVPGAERVARRAAGLAMALGGGDISVVLSSDREVRRLNHAHRGRDKPTNVLTYEPPAPGMPGEVIVALGVVRREAAASKRAPAHHLAHLVLHGALHLAGHDHDRAGDARKMEMREARLLARIGVPNPWRRA